MQPCRRADASCRRQEIASFGQTLGFLTFFLIFSYYYYLFAFVLTGVDEKILKATANENLGGVEKLLKEA